MNEQCVEGQIARPWVPKHSHSGTGWTPPGVSKPCRNIVKQVCIFLQCHNKFNQFS